MIAVLAVVMMMMRIMRMSNNWITQRCCNCGLFLLVGCSHPFYQPSFHLAPRQIDNPDHDDDLAPWCVLEIVMLGPSIRKIGWKISILCLWLCLYLVFCISVFVFACCIYVFVFACWRMQIQEPMVLLLLGCSWCSWSADCMNILIAPTTYSSMITIYKYKY